VTVAAIFGRRLSPKPMPSHLDTLPPEQAALLIKKKRFWKKTMWISLGFVFLVFMLGGSATFIGMIRAFRTLEQSGSADPAVLAGDISNTLIAGMIMLPFIALALLTFLVSLIRCLSLPKIPKA
jgi:MotA/TolQ/ExbB proton channel family